MVFKKVQVLFTKTNAVFLPGEVIVGKLCFFINSTNDVKVAELYLKFNGIAKVSWSEGTDDNSTTYSSKEIYCKLKYDIINPNATTFLAPGEHSYNFSFHLPKNIPPTFKGNHGDVTYICKVRAKIPWKFKNKYEFPVNVDSKLIDEDLLTLKKPHNLVLEKTFSLWFNSGTISINITLPKTAYRHGETVNITANVESNSNVAIKDLVLKLRKQIEFISSFPSTKTREDVKTIGKVHSGMLPTGFTEGLNYSILIPCDVEVFNLQCCSIINFNYILSVKVIFSGASRSLTENIPLVVTRG